MICNTVVLNESSCNRACLVQNAIQYSNQYVLYTILAHLFLCFFICRWGSSFLILQKKNSKKICPHYAVLRHNIPCALRSPVDANIHHPGSGWLKSTSLLICFTRSLQCSAATQGKNIGMMISTSQSKLNMP